MNVAVNKLVENLGSLPPIPHIATQVLRLTSDPDCSVGELQRVISSDQALAAQILKIANSAMFGSMRSIRTLPQAIITLGLNALKSSVVASIAKDMYMKSSMGFYKIIIWEHSLYSALAAGALAKTYGIPEYDEVFLGALMHDLGKSVIYFKYPDRYERIVNSFYNNEMPDNCQAEASVFGFDHAMVGEALLDAWNLPKAISQCVRWHHSPSGADPENVATACYVSLGNLFALEMGKGVKKPQRFDEAKKEALGLLNISEEEYDSRTELILEQIELDKALITGF